MNKQHLVDYTESPFSKIIAKEDYIKRIITVAKSKCNTSLDTPISKKIKIELRTWKKFVNSQYIKALTYQRLSEFCGLSSKEIVNGISYIDDIKEPKIPLNFNCRAGARLDCGVINEGRTRSRMVEFYELVPKYLRGNKKIKVNKWLTEDDKKRLIF